MSLLADLKKNVLDVLAPHGWGQLMEKHGLNISVPLDSLPLELERTLQIDRTIHGFEDFALGGFRAIEPGQPGRSLLYHALASPNVNPGTSSEHGFPTLEQLDIIENYTYCRMNARLDMFIDPVIAVFAYQYRDKDHTTHRQHADLAFSRTGIARVGNEPWRYVPELRGFDPRPEKGDRGFRVLPARYAAFIAERRPQPPNGSVMRGVTCDATLTFLFPVHKLFAGEECLFATSADGKSIPIPIAKIEFIERHVSEKLAKIHLPQNGQNPGYVEPLPNPTFDLSNSPFVRDSKTDLTMVKQTSVGSSVLVESTPANLVRTATQCIEGVDELVRFKVPKPAIVNNRRNRYWSTLEIPATGNSRAAPEYANIRQEVVKVGNQTRIKDLNQADAMEFDEKIQNGGYEAAHFVDSTCDGAIAIKPLKGIALPIQCAYSLITAVDYFPRVDQMEIEEWIERRQGRSIGLSDPQKQFPQGGPQPMSDGRFEWSLATGELVATRQVPNCTLPHPDASSQRAFSIADPSTYTATAVVGAAPTSRCVSTVNTAMRAPSWLPDGASDVFAPGWDVSQHNVDNQNMYAAYGLGSPFPEDAKLCAALNSFWPAVAPDSARTYGWRPPKPFSRTGGPLSTSIPLLDIELGYHAAHPRVRAGEVVEQHGWDGDYGPFLAAVDGRRFVDASNPMRADQTRAAFDGRLGFNGLDGVSTREFIRRMEALRWCREKFTSDVFDVPGSWLVTFEQVPDWSKWNSLALPRASTELTAAGIIFVFALTEPGVDYGTPPIRKQFPVKETLEVQLANLDDFTNLELLLEDIASPLVFYRKNFDPFAKKE